MKLPLRIYHTLLENLLQAVYAQYVFLSVWIGVANYVRKPSLSYKTVAVYPRKSESIRKEEDEEIIGD